MFNIRNPRVGGSMKYRRVALPALGVLLFTLAGFAQTAALEGSVKAEDGTPVTGPRGAVAVRRMSPSPALRRRQPARPPRLCCICPNTPRCWDAFSRGT